MKIKIANDIIEKCIHCKKGLACLRNGDDVCCKIERCVYKTLYYINSGNHNRCLYKMFYGLDHVCECPVRKEIFDKYNK